jgi:tetratricopeptide (TPR) repeat protein
MPSKSGRGKRRAEKGAGPNARRPPRPGGRRLSPELLAVLGIVGLAAGLRIAYTLASRSSPFFSYLDLDSRFYDLWAKRIAGGEWIGDEVFFMGPLYPYFLAVIYKLFGTELLTVKLIQSVLGSLTAAATYLLARECFGVVAGLVAGFLAAIYVPFIFYDNSILFPVLATLLNTLMLYFLCRGFLRTALGSLFAAGLLAGLSAAGNASVLAFSPLVAVFLAFHTRWPGALRLKAAALMALGVAVIVVPVTIRNYAVGKDFVPLTSNAGLNFYIGNNPKSTGAYVKPEQLDIYTDPSGESLAEAATGGDLRPSEVSSWWAGRALDYIRSNPAEAAHNYLRKLFFFWSVYEVPQIEHLSFEKRYSDILKIPSPTFGIVCPLGVVGAFLAIRRKREAALPALFALAYAFTITAFFVVARYRLPMIPALMAFGGYAVFWTIRNLGSRRYGSLARAGAAFAALYVLVHVNFFGVDPMSGFAQSHYRLGIAWERRGEVEAALKSYRTALSMDPDLTAAHLNLGILLSQTGDYEEARRALRRAVALDPDYAKAYYNLGLVYTETARNDSALAMMNRALKIRPDYHLAKLSKAAILYETARLESAESLLVEVRDVQGLPEPSRQQVQGLLRAIPKRRPWLAGRTGERQRQSDRYLLRGDDLLALGMADRALEAYERAICLDSLSVVALHEAGTLHFNRGDPDRAWRYFSRVLDLAPRFKGAHFARGVIAFRKGDIPAACREFERELEVDPASAASHINLAMCYEEHLGDIEQAVYHMERYIELTGGTQELVEHLKELKGRISSSDG